MSPFPGIGSMIAAFPTPATVALAGEGQLPHEAETATTVAWLPLASAEAPAGLEMISAVESRHLMALSKAAVPRLSPGSIVRAAPPEGGLIKTWRVMGISPGGQPDEIRAFLNPVEPQFP